MLDVRIHDKYQIELKTHYRFEPEKKRTTYALEIYMFVSSNLDLDATNYPKYLFYRDLQNYLRFETPRIALRHVISKAQSPFVNLERSLHRLSKKASSRHIKNSENQLRMFCCVVRKAMSEHITLLEEKTDSKDIAILVDQYLTYTTDILNEFRSLRAIITLPAMDKEIFKRYVLIDEYLSLISTEYAYRLLEALRKKELKTGNIIKNIYYR